MHPNELDVSKIYHENAASFVSTPRRQQTFMTAYTPRNDGAKETQKIQSMKLLIFKLAMHKAQIIEYIDGQSEDAKGTKAVRFEKLTEVLQKSMEIAKYKFCTYEKFANG